MWLRDGDRGDGRKAEWVMLFKICTENECMSDYEKCKKCKRTITYHFVESVDKFSDPD